ncbi:MAG: hypothetical protein AAF975_02385 [Spirochaetota bacterium]
MLYDSAAEYDQAIAETKAAISRVISAGASRSVGTGGSNRATTETELNSLRSHLQLLQNEKQAFLYNEQNGGGSSPGGSLGGFRMGIGW